MVPEASTDGRVARGDRTRATVLDAAIVMATEAGLDGLSLGQLAERLGVSKSGLFAHWRSKEELQLATIERAAQRLAGALDDYHRLLERLIREAVDAGELPADVDAGQLAFEINAIGTATVYES